MQLERVAESIRLHVCPHHFMRSGSSAKQRRAASRPPDIALSSSVVTEAASTGAGVGMSSTLSRPPATATIRPAAADGGGKPWEEHLRKLASSQDAPLHLKNLLSDYTHNTSSGAGFNVVEVN